MTNFQNAVDKCFKYYFLEIQACTSVNIARGLWLKGWSRQKSGNKTRLLNSDKNFIILDGDVPGAELNKAFFEFVIVDSIPFVLKFPQSVTAEALNLILSSVVSLRIATAK